MSDYRREAAIAKLKISIERESCGGFLWHGNDGVIVGWRPGAMIFKCWPSRLMFGLNNNEDLEDMANDPIVFCENIAKIQATKMGVVN